MELLLTVTYYEDQQTYGHPGRSTSVFRVISTTVRSFCRSHDQLDLNCSFPVFGVR